MAKHWNLVEFFPFKAKKQFLSNIHFFHGHIFAESLALSMRRYFSAVL